jgi:hypothetical protein
MGDFNLPLIDWSVLQAPDDGIHLPLLIFFCGNGFIQYNLQPTRSQNILDLVFCNDPLFHLDIRTEHGFGTSDHDKVFFSIQFNASMDQLNDSHFFHDFAKADYDQISLALS